MPILILISVFHTYMLVVPAGVSISASFPSRGDMQAFP